MFCVRTLCLSLLLPLLLSACSSEQPKKHPDGGNPPGADGSYLPDGGNPESGVEASTDVASDADGDVGVPDAAPDVQADALADAPIDQFADAPGDAGADACTPNACNGCSPLTNPPGTTCGTCGTSTYACSGTDNTVCQNPDDTNVCGGCGALPGNVGGACGSCGTYQCSGTSMSCVEGTPTVGTACGICGTSSYICSASPGKTACQTPDDRTTSADLLYTVITNGYGSAIAPAFPQAVTYVPGHNGNLVSVTFMMLSTYSATGTTLGVLTVSAYVGTPGGTSTLLDKVSLKGDAVPTTGQAKILFKFPNQPAVTNGTAMYFLISTTSNQYSYQVWGDGKAGGQDILYVTAVGAGWVQAQFSPWIDVELLACF